MEGFRPPFSDCYFGTEKLAGNFAMGLGFTSEKIRIGAAEPQLDDSFMDYLIRHLYALSFCTLGILYSLLFPDSRVISR